MERTQRHKSTHSLGEHANWEPPKTSKHSSKAPYTTSAFVSDFSENCADDLDESVTFSNYEINDGSCDQDSEMCTSSKSRGTSAIEEKIRIITNNFQKSYS